MSTALRIAYVCADPGVPVYGAKGCSVHVQEMVRALAAAGAEVHLFATRVDGDAPAGLAGVRLHRLPPVPRGSLAEREGAAVRSNDALRAALERLGPFDLVYERYSLWSFAAMEHAAASGVPAVLEVNAPLVDEQARYRALSDRPTAERVARRVFTTASAVVCVSEGVAAYVRGAGASARRVHVIPNAVDPARFQPGLRPARPAGPGTFTVGFVGSMKPWHGLDVLVDAFATFHATAPNTRLLVVGDGAERPEVDARAARLGVAPAVYFTGAVPPADVPALLASMDAAAAPYPPIERFYFSPLKVYEYMAAALPVVASRVGPLEGLILDGENGLLCPPGDVDALAAAIARLHADQALCMRLGQAAAETVRRDHTWEGTARRVIELALQSTSTATTAGTGDGEANAV